MPIELTSALSLIAFGALYFLTRNYIRCSRCEKIKNLVAWCFVEDNLGRRGPRDLFWHIQSAESKYKLPTEYCISGDTAQEQAKIILEAFKSNLLRDYFCDFISYTKSKYVIPEEHFFMFRLFCFLSDYLGDRRSISFTACDIILSCNTSGLDLTLQKLYYVSYLSCVNSPIYRDRIASWLTPKHFADILDELLKEYT